MIITTKRIFIQVTLSEEEKTEIINIAEEFHKNASEFMRDATFERIRHIKHPELFNNLNTQSINSEMFAQIMNAQRKTDELKEILIEKTKMLDIMNKNLESIQKNSEKQNISDKEMIVNLLKARKSLSQKEISNMTNIDKDIIFQILSDTNTFKLNMNGRFELND